MQILENEDKADDWWPGMGKTEKEGKKKQKSASKLRAEKMLKVLLAIFCIGEN